MRTLLISVLLIGVAVVGCAQQTEKVEKKAETFAELQGAYDKAIEKALESPAMKAAEEKFMAARKAMDEAKTPEQAKAARDEAIKAADAAKALDSQLSKPINKEYALKFLHFAESHKDDPAALDSLAWSLRTSGGPFNANSVWNAALKEIQTHHLAKADIKGLLPTLAGVNDDAAHGVLREIIAKHPDRKIQARACKSFANGLAEAADIGERLKKKEIDPAQIEKQTSKEHVARLMARSESNLKEAEALRQTLRDKYSDVLPDLSVGRTAPEVVSMNVDGKPAKLSELRGKVVVLDFWATWCGPCRQMIPHSREMVERLKDKPFVLVSISADDDKKALIDFMEHEKMPWTHWWSGGAGVIEDWDIEYFPMIFVLDANGVIRYKDVQGEELEDAVNTLLKEMEKPAAQE